MPKFHSLTVKEVRPETEDCVSVSFDVPAELTEEYSFKPGQYLTFKKEVAGEEIRRSYSICTAPFDNDLRVAIKRVENGKFSTYANSDLKAGDTLETMTPIGRFNTPLDPANEKHYIAFVAGSGITPVMSHMRTILSAEPKSEFTLVYGNKSTASIIFKEQIEDLKNIYMDRLRVFHVLSREANEVPILNGRIDEEKCNKMFETMIDAKSIDEAFLCGPAPLIEAGKKVLADVGLDRKQIHFELFASPLQLAEAQKMKDASAEKKEGFAAKVDLILNDVTTSFTMDSQEDNILDAAMKHGADVPYACKGGVCATCRAKVDKGEVDMDINYSLEPDELERGFVLTCQSHPKTEHVVINFDEA